MGRDDEIEVDVGDDSGEFVAYTEVRKQGLALLVEAGYEIEEGADEIKDEVERPIAKKVLDGDISIRVTERAPTPEFRFWLVKEEMQAFGVGGIPMDSVRRMSYRNPEKILQALSKIEARMREMLGVRCPHCGGPMGRRKVRNPQSKHMGKTFLGCLRYPECRGTIADWMPRSASDDGKLVGAACPDCGEPLVIRYCKREDLPHRGSSFIGCTGFPKCKRIVTKEELVALKIIGPDALQKNNEDLDEIF